MAKRPLKTLERVLSKAGIGSRTDARAWIAEGRVKVNGRITRDPDQWIDMARDRVRFDNEPYDVVGVTPPHIDYPGKAQVWIPPHWSVPDDPLLMMNLAKTDIRTIIWATGYRPDYTWLEVPVLDHKGMIRHDGGITSSPGLYLMGAPFMRRRKSTLIDGAGDDARDLSGHLASYIGAGAEHAMALEHAL